MRRGGIWIGRALGVLSAAFLVYLLWLLGETGSFDALPAIKPLACAAIGPGIGVTDAALDPQTGTAYLAGIDKSVSEHRALYALDLRAAEPALHDITPPGVEIRRPAGIGFYRGPDGQGLVFLVDRLPAGAKVEIFALSGTDATLRETISDPAFRSLNDIAPVGPRQFYASNDHDAPSGLGRALESLFSLPRANLVYFDGTLADPAAKGLSGPRGVALSADGRRLYAAEGLRHRVIVYARDPATGALTEERRLSLRAMPDKINLDASGRLWISAQPRLVRLFLHFVNARFAAPSLVLALDPAEGAATAVYADDGAGIADARVALAGEGRLLIASSREPKILLCRLP